MQVIHKETIRTVDDHKGDPTVETISEKEETTAEALTAEPGYMPQMRTTIVGLTVLLWGVLMVLGLCSLVDAWQTKILKTVSDVLMPLFKTTIVASLTYIFGQPVSEGVRRYLIGHK